MTEQQGRGLPIEVLLHLWSYLEPERVFGLSLVCSQWNEYLKDPTQPWKMLHHRYYGGKKKNDSVSWRDQVAKEVGFYTPLFKIWSKFTADLIMKRAIRKGHVKVVRRELKKVLNANELHPCYLNLAAYLGNIKICRLLLRARANPNGVSVVVINSDLATQSKTERKRVIANILSTNPPAQRGRHRSSTVLTPLYLALLSGVSLRLVRLFVEEGGVVANRMAEIEQQRYVTAACVGDKGLGIPDYLMANGWKAASLPTEYINERIRACVVDGDTVGLRFLLAGQSDKKATVEKLELLGYAAKGGVRHVVEYLLGDEIGVSANGPSGSDTPLAWAASGNSIDIMELLISKGADIPPLDRKFFGGHPLWCALNQSAMDAVKFLFEKGGVAPNDDYALRLALNTKHHGDGIGVEVCQLLLANETAPDWRLAGAQWAVNGCSPRILSMLLEDGERNWLANNINHPINNFSLLHFSASSPENSLDASYEIPNILLSNGADPLLSNKDGLTPVQIVIDLGQREKLKVFFEFHPDLASALVPLPNPGAETRLWDWLNNRNDEDERKNQTVDNLDENVSTKTQPLWTLLHHVAKTKHVQVAKYLLKKGANLSTLTVDETPESAFSIACKQGLTLDMIDFFLKSGYSVTPNELRDILFALCRLKRMNIIKHLEEKLSINNWSDFIDEEGNTLLHAALSTGDGEYINYFLSKGLGKHEARNKEGKTARELMNELASRTTTTTTTTTPWYPVLSTAEVVRPEPSWYPAETTFLSLSAFTTTTPSQQGLNLLPFGATPTPSTTTTTTTTTPSQQGLNLLPFGPTPTPTTPQQGFTSTTPSQQGLNLLPFGATPTPSTTTTPLSQQGLNLLPFGATPTTALQQGVTFSTTPTPSTTSILSQQGFDLSATSMSVTPTIAHVENAAQKMQRQVNE